MFLGVFVRRQQIDRFHMAKVNIVAQQEYEQQFTDIFLLLVAVQRFIAFEFAANVSQFLVDTLNFCFFAFA